MRGISLSPKGVRRTARRVPLHVVAVVAALGVILPAPASGSTVGVPNLEQVPVSDTGILSQPPPYSVWQSGNRDGSTEFYASENGFLTEVSIAHWNTADVTVRIYIFRRDSGNAIKVAQSVMTMLLPAAPKTDPIVTTLPVTSPTPIAVGDRIGMTVVSGGSSLHAIVDNLSPYPAPGVYPTAPPSAEPTTGDSYDFIASAATGPLIRGTVSSTPDSGNPPPGGGSTPTGGGTSPGGGSTPAARTTPAARAIKLPTVKSNRKIVTSAHCNGLGIRSRCTGKVIVELDYKGNVVSVSEEASTSKARPKMLGSATYDIPDGATKRIVVKLNQAGRSKLKNAGKLNAFLVFREEIDGQTLSTGTKFTVRFKKQGKKKQAARPSVLGADRPPAPSMLWATLMP